MQKVLIFGHKNPDTDSVCASIALSCLKNELGMNTEPRILAPISKETEFVLNYFKIKVPEYLNDVKVELKDVNYHKNYIINENKTIFETFNLMNNYKITGLPLVGEKKEFKGYVSLKEIVANMIDDNNKVLSTTFANILATLEETDFLKIDDEINGSLLIVTDNLEINEINNESIILTNDEESIIRKLINKSPKLIIATNLKKFSQSLKVVAKENKVNLISTNESLFKVSRTICLANPVKSIKRNQVIITFNEHDYLTDFNEETKKYKHTNYPIVNNDNICLGMLRTIDAHEVKRKKVILVDHNTLSQSVDGLYEANILEIIDHHNLGDINTSVPVNFRNMAVGSVSTIIYYLYKENNIKIKKDIAGLLLSGIISDTLLLESPTTTLTDKLVAEDLAKIAKLNIKDYGLKLLSSGVSIEGLSDNEIIYKDFKEYKVSDNLMAIAQVFTTNFDVFLPRLDSLVAELNRIDENHNYKACVLFVTNFLTNTSYVIYSSESKRIIELSYGIKELHQGYEIKGIVSRKKQIVPYIMSTLENL